MMRLDETILRAYLDEELSPPEQEQVEQLLAESPEAQAVLARIRQTSEQVNQVLSRLAPIGETVSSASAALRKLQTQVGASNEVSVPEAAPSQPSTVMWESPSLWYELKTIFIKLRKGQLVRGVTMLKGFALITASVLLIITGAIALTRLGPNQAASVGGVGGAQTGSGLPGVIEAAATDTPVPPTPTYTPLPPTPVPATGNITFSYGIQADPLGDTEANIGHIKKLGFEWVKFQMPWKQVEATQGSYDWASWDAVLDAYAANGIKVMLTVVKAPDWARPTDDDKSIEGPPADPANYAEFVAKVAEHYRGKVQAIEIWNEQNLWYEAGGKGQINAADYVKLLQQAYPAIKAVNKELIVISGGLTPAGNVADPQNARLALAVDDVDYLKQMYMHGVKGYFDILGTHPAGYSCPALADWRTVTPEEASADPDFGLFTQRHHSWCFLGTMEAYREVMIANDDGDKAIAITEFGWAVASTRNPGYEYAADNTPAEQSKWIVEAYAWGKKQGWVGPMFLWNLDYSITIPGTELGYFSILNTPAYDALVKMPK